MSRATRSELTDQLENTAAAWVFRRTAGLTPEEEAALERWQAADPRHRAALARHERAWSALDRPRQTGQADFLLAKLAKRAARRRRWRWRVTGVGTAVAVLMASGIFWLARQHPVSLRDTARVVIVLPERQTLADGSIVELKSGARIAVDFGGPVRRVALLRGEAHFQVASQDRPFVVAAGDIEFRAVGTAFSVQLASTQVELLVTEGRVAVEGAERGLGTRDKGPHTTDQRPEVGSHRSEIGEQGPGTESQRSEDRGQPMEDQILSASSPSPSPPHALSPLYVDAGNRVVVARGNDAASTMIVSPTAVLPEQMAERLAWRAPKLEFTETPLAEAVDLMNRHNRMTLVIQDAELGRLRVSGLFRADRAEAFVRLLEANFDVRTERSGQTIRLHRKR